MIPWKKLGEDVPRITEQLVRMMVDEAIPAIIDGLEATPAVGIRFKLADGSGEFEVRLSIDMVDPDDLDDEASS